MSAITQKRPTFETNVRAVFDRQKEFEKKIAILARIAFSLNEFKYTHCTFEGSKIVIRSDDLDVIAQKITDAGFVPSLERKMPEKHSAVDTLSVTIEQNNFFDRLLNAAAKQRFRDRHAGNEPKKTSKADHQEMGRFKEGLMEGILGSSLLR